MKEPNEDFYKYDNHLTDMKSDKICPLLKSQCVREKCVCFYMRKTDTFGLGMEVEPYGACSYFNINLDYVEEN